MAIWSGARVPEKTLKHLFHPQFYADLEAVAAVTEFDVNVGEVLQCPSLLFTDAEIRQIFLMVDPKAMQSAANSVCIPPPEAAPRALETSAGGRMVPNVAKDSSPGVRAYYANVIQVSLVTGKKGWRAPCAFSNFCILCGNF